MDELVAVISEDVSSELAKVLANDPSGNNLELQNKLLLALQQRLTLMQAKIKELGSLTNDSVDLISKDLALKINQNQDLNAALVSTGKNAPRFLGALALGITQVVTDVVKMALTRYS